MPMQPRFDGDQWVKRSKTGATAGAIKIYSKNGNGASDDDAEHFADDAQVGLVGGGYGPALVVGVRAFDVDGAAWVLLEELDHQFVAVVDDVEAVGGEERGFVKDAVGVGIEHGHHGVAVYFDDAHGGGGRGFEEAAANRHRLYHFVAHTADVAPAPRLHRVGDQRHGERIATRRYCRFLGFRFHASFTGEQPPATYRKIFFFFFCKIR